MSTYFFSNGQHPNGTIEHCPFTCGKAIYSSIIQDTEVAFFPPFFKIFSEKILAKALYQQIHKSKNQHWVAVFVHKKNHQQQNQALFFVFKQNVERCSFFYVGFFFGGFLFSLRYSRLFFWLFCRFLSPRLTLLLPRNLPLHLRTSFQCFLNHRVHNITLANQVCKSAFFEKRQKFHHLEHSLG